jgi:uncharacterized protein YlxW (UPF0749 family)
MRGAERAAIIVAIVTGLSGILAAFIQSRQAEDRHAQMVLDLKDSYALTAAKVNDLAEKVGMLEGYVTATQARAVKADKALKSVLKLDDITVAGHVGAGVADMTASKPTMEKPELAPTLTPALPETLDDALKAKRAAK